MHAISPNANVFFPHFLVFALNTDYSLPKRIQNPVKHLRRSRSFQPLTIFEKKSILDVLLGSYYTKSENAEHKNFAFGSDVLIIFHQRCIKNSVKYLR